MHPGRLRRVPLKGDFERPGHRDSPFAGTVPRDCPGDRLEL